VGWWRTGSTHIQRGEVETGLRCCDEALALKPIPFDAAMARAMKGFGMARAGQTAAGIALLEEVATWLEQFNLRYTRTLIDLFRSLSLEQARGIASDLIRAFTAAECDAVHLVYNEFKSVIQQQVVVEQLLPIPRDTFGHDAFRGAASVGAPTTAPGGDAQGAGNGAGPAAPDEDYIYEPGDRQLFETLLPKHVEIQVYRALLESSAAEQGARMNAMANATRNAEEMIGSLTLQMNKIRQAAITKEILEVVSGAEALR